MTIQIIYNEYPLNYDNQTGIFTVGNTVYGATSGASATIRRIDRSGTSGTLYLQSISGTFEDNEIIYEATYEDELLSNTGFETAGVGGADIFANWGETASDGSIDDEGSLVHGGSHACKLTQGASLATEIYSTSVTAVDGAFYFLSIWTRGDGTYSGRFYIYQDIPNSGNIDTNITGSSYTEVTKAFQMSGTGLSIYLKPANTNGAIAYFDDISVKKLTNAALADGTVQSPITIDLELDKQGLTKDFVHERNVDHSYSGKVQIMNKYGIQEMQMTALFNMSTYYSLLAWWSWARQGKLWAFTMDSSKVGNTTLDGGAAAGQKVVPVASTTDFATSDVCLLKREDVDDTFEVISIASIASGTSVSASANLKFNYTSGDSLKHLEYWPEVVSLDGSFKPVRTGVNSTSGKYWKHTFRFTEAL